MRDKLQIWATKFSEAFTACGLAMVQGDITILSLGHVGVASKVGFITGLACVIASFIKWNYKYLSLFLTGLFTMIADYLIHHSHYSGQYTEAILTGFCAMFIAYLFEKQYKTGE